MATNERVDYTSNDLGAGQQSPSQASRTQFYPGKATSREGDMAWEKDNRIPQGTPAFSGEAAGPVEMQRSRVVKLGRNIVDDQVMHGDGGTFPHAGTPAVTTIVDKTRWENDPTSTLTPVDEKEADGRFERRTGGDRVVGA